MRKRLYNWITWGLTAIILMMGVAGMECHVLCYGADGHIQWEGMVHHCQRENIPSAVDAEQANQNPTGVGNNTRQNIAKQACQDIILYQSLYGKSAEGQEEFSLRTAEFYPISSPPLFTTERSEYGIGPQKINRETAREAHFLKHHAVTVMQL